MAEINGITLMSVPEFFALPNGTHVYNYGNDQCVALANQYVGGALQYQLPVSIQSAFQWWTTYDIQPNLYNNFTQVTDNPQHGDVFIGRYGPYQAENGHIGVVERSWDGSTFGTMEQGLWNGGSSEFVTRLNRNMNYILGFLRPKSNVNPTFGEEELKLILSDPAQGGDGSIALVGEFTFTPVGNMDQVNAFSKVFGSYSAVSREEFNYNAEQVSVRKSQFGGAFQVNVDAIAKAIADKINGGGTVVPDTTSKAEILSAIETNYPEDK